MTNTPPPYDPRNIGPSLWNALDFDWRNGAKFADGTIWTTLPGERGTTLPGERGTTTTGHETAEL